MTGKGTKVIRITDEEKAILREFGPKMTAQQLAEKLPGRSRQWADNHRRILGKSPGRSPRWDPAETHTLKSMPDVSFDDLMVLLPGRTPDSISQKRKELGLTPSKKITRFTPEDDEYIKKAYPEYVPISEMALHLNRAIGTLRQRILALGLHRESRRSRLISRFGAVAADLSKPVDTLREEFVAKAKIAAKELEAKVKEDLNQALEAMKAAIANGTPRRQAFQFAMVAGATLNDIGMIYGISRERVRQIVYHVKPKYQYKKKDFPKYRKRKSSEPIQKNCTQCGDPFETKVKQTKYCAKCRPLMAKAQNRVFAINRYKKMRVDSLSKKIASLSPEERKQILSQLEGPNHATENNQPADGQTSDDQTKTGGVQGSD